MLLPLRRFCKYDKAGGELYDPDLDTLLVEGLRRQLRSDITVIDVDTHINDLQFAQSCVAALVDISPLKKKGTDQHLLASLSEKLNGKGFRIW